MVKAYNANQNAGLTYKPKSNKIPIMLTCLYN